MSTPSPAEGGRRRPLLIENIYEKETTESFIERNFRERTLHRCRQVAAFNVDAIVEQYGSDLIRSGQELVPDPGGKGMRPVWTMLLFRREQKSFWLFMIKSNNSYDSKDVEREFTLTVTADTPKTAADDTLMLQKHFTESDDAPGFFMVRDTASPSASY